MQTRPSRDSVRAAEYWDREIIEQSHVSWMADPLVRRYVNESFDDSWPMDWFVRWLGSRRFARALSIGCGTGALERDLLNRGLCDRVDAFDGSMHSLHIARREAQAAGMAGRIRYFASDFNEPHLPKNTYDAVFFHQSMHHVAKLEKLLRAVLLSLVGDGLLYIDEYIGPSALDWTGELVADQRAVYDALPSEVKVHPVLPLPIRVDDPSEAFRAGEIVPQLHIGFEVVERRDYGGNLLAVVFPSIRWASAPPALVEHLIREERRLLAVGAEALHSVMVLRPKHGLGKYIATSRYFLEPKLKRVARELRRLVRKLGPKTENA